MQTESKNTNKALKILKTEINKLKIFNIDDKRIEKAKNGLLKSFELRFDTNKNMLRTLSSINDYEMHDNYFERYTEGINLVTKESIISSLQSDLQFEKILITTVGNN
jgi:zinc protease